MIDQFSGNSWNSTFEAALAAISAIHFSRSGSAIEKCSVAYRKITETARVAKEKGLDYCWIDTCCIDKTSSAELQEAINSMWRWYSRSAYCIVYIEDSSPVRMREDPDGELVDVGFIYDSVLRSRWITRGWTLQEPIAPRYVGFHEYKWQFAVTKSRGVDHITIVTSIPASVLLTANVSQSSFAQRMAWAFNRTTTRIEDTAYCLLGIFDVHMPLLYGEGSNAFRRLQEQIINTDPDDSILAWGSAGEDSESSIFSLDASNVQNALAGSPQDFRLS